MDNFKHTYLIVALLLVICLIHMPYGYYQFIRFVCMTFFSILAYIHFKEQKAIIGIICIALVLLWQPFIKPHFGRLIWNVIDIVTAVGLVALWVNENSTKKNK